MPNKYIRGAEATEIISKWINHLRNEHGLTSNCETINELIWFNGEAISNHVVLGLPKPKRENE